MNDYKALIARAEADCKPLFDALNDIERANTRKVLGAFKEYRVSARNFAPTTGYGYDDIGRDALSGIMARVLGCEAALVRPQITSGTHALALTLFGILRPGDTLLSAVGKPYDTLNQVISASDARFAGSLADFGINYAEVALKDGAPDEKGILDALNDDVKLVLLQRSRGYEWRPSLSVAQIDRLIDIIHVKQPDTCVMVDNCYGEFTCVSEPKADLLAGSLIKNPGGGLAPTGGYIAGRAHYVERVAYRLTSPGIGAEVGAYAGGYQPYYQGLFLAPHTVAQALRVSILFARAFELLGYDIHPKYNDARGDIIQAIRFGDREKLIRFVQVIQLNSPVDAFAAPEPWDMPGYSDQVIMAAGTFVSGASIELSADAPLRAPYTAYLQGGLTYAHGYLALESILKNWKEN